MSEVNSRTCARVPSATCRTLVTDLLRHAREGVRCYASPAFSLSSLLVAAFFDCTALGPTAILIALTHLDTGPKTAGLSRVLSVLGFISIFMY